MAQDRRGPTPFTSPRVYRRTGRFWHADFRPWGGKRRVLRNPKARGWPRSGERTEFRDVAEEWAWAYVRRLQGKTYRQQTGQPEPAPHLRPALDRWLGHRSATVTPNTYKGDVTVANHLRRTFTDARLDDMDLQGWANHLAETGYKSSTIRQYLRTAGAMMEHAGVEPPEVDVRDDGSTGARAWTDGELVALRRAADEIGGRERLERIVCTGARKSEALALRWGDFHPTARTVLIARQVTRTGRGTKPTKGKRLRTALVLPEYWEHYEPGSGLIEDPPPSQTALQMWFQGLKDHAGLGHLRRVGLHACRHAYARLFLERGGDLMELSRFLGHKSIETTRQYYEHFSTQAAVRLGRRAIYGEG